MTALRLSFVISSPQRGCAYSQICSQRNLEMQLFHPQYPPFHGMPVGWLMQLEKMFVALILSYLYLMMSSRPVKDQL